MTDWAYVYDELRARGLTQAQADKIGSGEHADEYMAQLIAETPASSSVWSRLFGVGRISAVAVRLERRRSLDKAQRLFLVLHADRNHR
jgi:hypothetical protein